MATQAKRGMAFYENVLRTLESEGFPDRSVLRTFPADAPTEAIEVLLIHAGRYAETIWVSSEGVLVHGPVPGFGAIPGV